MNILIIPSWYPSADEPLSGIFTKEQIVAIAEHFPYSRFGISLWGQKSEENLLWAKDHIRNVAKLQKGLNRKPSSKQLGPNLTEYVYPTFTWTDKILKGNIAGIVEANGQNLRRFIAQSGSCSVLHAHTSFPAGYVAQQLSQKFNIPYVITEHMSPFPFESYLHRGKISEKILKPLSNAHAVIAVSPSAAKDIQQKTGVVPVVIPNLVNERIFKPVAQSEKTSSTPPFTFFTLGRMVPQKGVPDLLQAIALLQNKQVKFRIGGDGTHLTTYTQLADTLGISDQIDWLGALDREEAAREFNHCQAFVLPSLHESMGVVFAEALACGKPIIATRCGGPEFLVKKHNGLLVDVQAPHHLAQAMDHMINHIDEYSSAEIRADFKEHFASEKIIERVYALYKSLI